MAMRMVVPELPTSMGDVGAVRLPSVPDTVQVVPSVLMVAPRAEYASTAERVSLESRAPSMVLSPEARDAMATARMVCDFDPGMATVP